ncbi:MAG: ABC transporter substrate-binding protein, partial [bacterium]
MRNAIIIAMALMLIAPAADTGLASPARPQVTWKFTLDFAVQGPQAPFIVALEKGYFAAEGITLTIDRGFGSADAVTKIASGAYDLGYADL